MGENFNPLVKVSFDMMLRPIQVVSFDDAKFDLYMISGFLTEKWFLPHGAQKITMGELASSDWLRHLVKLAQENHFNLYFYNWAAQSLLEKDYTFFDDFEIFSDNFQSNQSRSSNSESSVNFTLPNDYSSHQIDPKFVAKLLKQETPFLLRVVDNANKIKEAITPKILKKWSNALQATIPAAIELEKFIVSTNRKTILLGHSLGGRVALKTMEFISNKKLEPISCIAMAPAILCSELNIQHLRNRTNKIEVFFSESDMVLSLIYRIAELTPEKPIGLAGANFKISREINYSCRNKQSIGHNNYEANLVSLLSESEIFQKYKQILL